MIETNRIHNRYRIFQLLLLYRWVSLIPPLIAAITLSITGQESLLVWGVLLTAVFLNSIILIFATQLNRAVRARPIFLIVDIFIAAVIIAVTGGWQSPYILYVMSPLMAAALFFELRGALISATVFTPFYLLAVITAVHWGGTLPESFIIIVNIVGFYLTSSVVGYATMLMARLQVTSRELTVAHHELQALHAFTAALHSAADVAAVQEMTLTAVTENLGYKKAVVGLVSPDGDTLSIWMGQLRGGTIRTAHSIHIPLIAGSGLAAESLLDGRICRATDAPCTSDAWINELFDMNGCLIVPMQWRAQPVGVLMVDTGDHDNDPTRLQSLEAIAQQTAVTLGMMKTRRQRAKETAVQDERLRIAQDMHDSVSQSLFGIVLTLDGCIKLLPDQPQTVIPELERAMVAAQSVRTEIRHSILDLWPTTLTADIFLDDLHQYAIDVCQLDTLLLEFDVRGDFSLLSPGARRSLYRISQEALNNIAQHAAATEARVCVDVENGRSRLVVRDNGRGFDTESSLTLPRDKEHFGLQGIQKRADGLGGECHIFSKVGAGTSIAVDIPV